MTSKSSVFMETYQNYLHQIAKIHMDSRSEKLGTTVEGGQMILSFFGQPYRISGQGIKDPSGKQPAIGISVVICKYLLLCPEIPSLDTEWVSYRDFKDAAPLASSFVNNTEGAIAHNFSGRLDELTGACEKLGGWDPDLALSYQLVRKLYPLPKVPVLLLFDDIDEEFPAQCKVLFERRAEHYLDPECLAILGMLLSDFLDKAVPGG